MRHRRLPRQAPYAVSLAATAFIVLGCLSASEAATRIAVLPFQNVSGHMGSPGILTPVILQGLAARGYGVVSGAVLEPVLIRERIRNTGMLGHRHVRSLAAEFQVDGVMLGSIALFSEALENPHWGLTLRLLDTRTARLIWAASAGLTGDDFSGPFGLGRVRDPAILAHRLARDVLQSLPSPGAVPVATEERGRGLLGLLRRGPDVGYGSPTLRESLAGPLAVLPLENTSERKGAAIIVTDIVVAHLVKRGFSVIEPGEVAEALIALRSAPFGSIDLETLRGLRQRTGAGAVLLGTVHDYNEGIQRGGTTSPSVALDLRILETESGRIIWSAHHEGEGANYRVVLDFGKIRSMVPLVNEVIHEMFSSL
jgi:hypothetical protein